MEIMKTILLLSIQGKIRFSLVSSLKPRTTTDGNTSKQMHTYADTNKHIKIIIKLCVNQIDI